MARKPKAEAMLTIRCVYNKKHTQQISEAELARESFPPLCPHDGGPMVLVNVRIGFKKGR